MTAIITVASFRTNFTEFAAAGTYPDATVQFWLDVAYLRLPAKRWNELLNMGAQLFTAHNLVLEVRNKAQAAKGAPPGETVGAVNNKSVDKVSIGYDAGVTTVEGMGNYNMTNYGTRFAELVKIVGAGATQVGSTNASGFPWC